MAKGRDSGSILPASLASFDPDTCSWKTSQCSLFGGLIPFSATWPRSGMIVSGRLYRQPTWVRRTFVSASGSLPTPTAKANALAPSMQKWRAHRNLLPTPSAVSYGSNQGGGMGRVGPVRHSLATMAKKNLWPTPTAQDAKNDGGPSQHQRNSIPLNTLVKWPTPTTVSRTGGADMSKWGGARARAKLRTIVTPEEFTGSLNPQWVEWLMGFPTEWTALERSATRSSRKSLKKSAKR